jgi:hypothetical protein
VNAKNVDIADETLGESFLDHDGPEGKPIDRAGDKAMMRGMHARFPDLHVTIEDMIAEGDKVVCRNVWRATDGNVEGGGRSCGDRGRAGEPSPRKTVSASPHTGHGATFACQAPPSHATPAPPHEPPHTCPGFAHGLPAAGVG